MKKAFKCFLAVAAFLLMIAPAFGQITTANLAGQIVDEGGEPLIGAAVVAVHTPSGTTYYAVTNEDGRYTIQGMRTGGPYEVTYSLIGCQTVVIPDIVLSLAETYQQNVVMKTATELLNEAIVVATASSKFSTEKTGAATNISNQQITNLPSVSRAITDVTRLSPYGGNGMSFAGADGRMANFTVDGANFNNNFGLSSNLPGGGNPISIDAIEELQVVISPYDVRQTNFIGGGVNAITKSGTNTFRGSAYVYHKNENMQGDAVDGEQITGARNKNRSTTYGFTAGGPIVKNKLFFFVNGEYSMVPSIVNRWRGSDNGVADPDNYVSRTRLSDLQRVSEYVKSKYGYDTGSWTEFPANENNMKILARLDWNISQKHKLALRYNYTKNNVWNSPNGSSMDGGPRMSGARMSQYSMSFANAMYSMQKIVSTWSLDLNSRLSDNVSNQFLATFSKLDDVRGTNSSEFPFIDILDDTQSNNYMALGYELFTWNNAVHNTIANVKDDITWYKGNHKVTAGISYEYQMADNQYMRNGTGYYRYKSVDDFLSGAIPQVVCLTYGYDGEQYPAARVQFHKAGIYAQDDWNVTDRFKLTYGVRIDGLFFDNGDLMTNKAIIDKTYYPRVYNYEETHIDTGRWPTSKVTFSPRVGFSWDVFGDKSFKVRGGTGLFSGRLPLVFFTNMPTNGGMVQYQAQIGPSTRYANLPDAVKSRYASVNDILAQFGGGLVTENGQANVAALYNKLVGMGFPSTVRPEDGTVPSAVNGVDPRFKMPQVWKSSLAFDYSFPTSFPFTFTAEGIFNKTINAVAISDWSMRDVAGFARFNGADNRPIYPTDFRYETKAFVLENTNQGYGWSASAQINMRPIESLSLMAAYTHTVNKEITGMPGSAAESAFTYVPTNEGPNYIKLHNSQYVTPDRVVASLTHHDKSGNHYSFIYEAWRGGYNYSYMTTNDMNGDGYNYDALYIPTDEEVSGRQFRFVSSDDQTRFMDFVHNDKYLRTHQGSYAEGYSVYSPWVHRVDFSYKHDFTVKCGKNTNTLQLCLDLKNVLNLFNSSWGVSKYLNPAIGSDARILKYEGVDAEGYATFSTPSAISGTTETFVPNHALGQCWYASVGIKYLFN
ncbi:MAG: TonB-dependent receptor [Bacteroidales bacterium]|nr:TonB-dependent receptor [Bacteroidales bacterium]